MGFLDKLKKTFTTGALDIDLDVAETFRWSDESLPVTVTVTGDDEEPRTVNSVTFRIVEDLMRGHDEEETPSQRARRRRRIEDRAFTYVRDEAVTLAPGESVTFTVDLPISQGRLEITSADGEDAPGWLKAAGGLVNLATDSLKERDWFNLEVTTDVEGFSARKTESRRLRNLGFGEFKIL